MLIRELGNNGEQIFTKVVFFLFSAKPKKSIYGKIRRVPGRNTEKDRNEERSGWVAIVFLYHCGPVRLGLLSMLTTGR